MAHWDHRPEAKWKEFRFNQPYAKGLARLKDEVLAKTDFDPATLWQWGTMQAMALIEILKDAEATFGEEGQKLVYRSLHKIGLDVGRQLLAGVEIPETMTDAAVVAATATTSAIQDWFWQPPIAPTCTSCSVMCLATTWHSRS